MNYIFIYIVDVDTSNNSYRSSSKIHSTRKNLKKKKNQSKKQKTVESLFLLGLINTKHCMIKQLHDKDMQNKNIRPLQQNFPLLTDTNETFKSNKSMEVIIDPLDPNEIISTNQNDSFELDINETVSTSESKTFTRNVEVTRCKQKLNETTSIPIDLQKFGENYNTLYLTEHAYSKKPSSEIVLSDFTTNEGSENCSISSNESKTFDRDVQVMKHKHRLNKTTSIPTVKRKLNRINKTASILMDERKSNRLNKTASIPTDKRKLKRLNKTASTPTDERKSNRLNKIASIPMDERKSNRLNKTASIPMDERKSNSLNKTTSIPMDERKSNRLNKTASIPMDERKSNSLNKTASIPTDERKSNRLNKTASTPMDERESNKLNKTTSISMDITKLIDCSVLTCTTVLKERQQLYLLNIYFMIIDTFKLDKYTICSNFATIILSKLNIKVYATQTDIDQPKTQKENMKLIEYLLTEYFPKYSVRIAVANLDSQNPEENMEQLSYYVLASSNIKLKKIENFMKVAKKYFCNFCKIYFHCYILYLHHLHTAHNIIKTKMFKVYETIYVTKNYIFTDTSKNTAIMLACYQCKIVFPSHILLKQHFEYIHDIIKMEDCNARENYVEIEKELKDDRTSAMNHKKLFTMSIACYICKMIFQSDARLLDHLKCIHGVVKSEVCKICGKSFITVKELDEHKSNKHVFT